MKKELKLFAVLVAIIFSTFSFASKTLFQTVEATYVEGSITQDTIWTLVDSPFVVSNDIVVYPDATLTIESGVEVRFGGAFFLNVSGKLYANGTDKAIKFTSNRKQSIAGDWGAIKFGGTEKSEVVCCLLAYGTDGILVENGNVEIENTNISLCSRNGITVVDGKLAVQTCNVNLCSQNGIDATNSELTVKDTMIMENGDNGIVITGNQQVTIQRNIIVANENGILLTGNETSLVNIRQNVISANKQNGLQLDADNHANLVIIYNNISSNNRGFYFASPTSTNINNNTISYNGIGIFYEEGNHTVHFNDIYGNELGMDVASGANVAAEHNYWGHESGPYHEILNPDGKGDPVGGEGVNLDFIFFLTKSYSYINVRPTATLYTDKTLVSPNGTVMFFAANSFDEGRVDLYLYDFGDGNTSGWTPLSIFTHQYFSQRVYNVSVTVMDDFGATSINNANATIDVQDLQPLYVNIGTSDHIVYEGEQILITVHVTDGTSPIENAKVELFSLKGGDFTESIGYTNSTGYFTTTFTAPDVIYLTNVRIAAKASESGYTDGSSYEDLESLPSLSIQVVANPNTIKSEETTQVTVYVKSNEQTVADTAVLISSDTGNLSTTTGFTNLDGIFLLDFTAPQITDLLKVNIVVTAAKNEYLDGIGETVITVEPKVLVVHVTAQPSATVSEASVNISVHVEYDTPISDANINLTSESFSETGLTDMFGDVTFAYTAPQVNTPSNITITAWASKDKYAHGYDQLQITVNPGRLDVQVEIDKSIVGSGESTVISVYVTCNGTPIEDTEVTMSANHGIFSASTNNTDSEGYCEFIFDAPRTTVQLNATIVANATKNGYIYGRGQTTITVTADLGGGWPLITILLMIIPIVIVVIIVVLVKLKIIAFSTEEQS